MERFFQFFAQNSSQAEGRMSEPLFRTENLSVRFGGLAALTGMDLEIQKGEIIGLIGPNGAGKTTAFNAITGLAKPVSGKVVFHGQDVTGWSANKIARNGIARTFQNIRLYTDLTLVENVMIGATRRFATRFWKLSQEWVASPRRTRTSAEGRKSLGIDGVDQYGRGKGPIVTVW